MKRFHFMARSIFRIFILSIALIWFSLPRILAQLPAEFQRSFDEYFTEIVKVYKIIESENVDVALRKIEDLKPSIEQKAKKVARFADGKPDLLVYLDSEEFMQIVSGKPYFVELMRITQSEEFGRKFMGNTELQAKVEEVENIIETYVDSGNEYDDESEELNTDVAFSITINGPVKYAGTYKIRSDFEEGAIAFIDDLEYLRMDIMGDVNGQEAMVSFFVDNSGTGKQEWATEGHFVFELMDTDGNLMISLWGNEEMGYFDITKMDAPGGFVSGKIAGKCIDGEGNSEKLIQVNAEFKVGYIDIDY